MYLAFKKIFFIFNYAYLWGVGYEPDSSRDQKRVSDPMELELQVVANHLLWMWGTEPPSSAINSEPSLQPLFNLLNLLRSCLTQQWSREQGTETWSLRG